MNGIVMKIKTVVKMILFMFLFIGVFIGNSLLFWYLTYSVDFMLFSGFISLIIMVLIIGYLFPIVFRDYSAYFYKKEETKNATKKKG